MIEPSIWKMPYGSWLAVSRCMAWLGLGLKLLSRWMLLQLRDEWEDLLRELDLSNSVALEVLIILRKTQMRHLMILSESLLGGGP